MSLRRQTKSPSRRQVVAARHIPLDILAHFDAMKFVGNAWIDEEGSNQVSYARIVVLDPRGRAVEVRESMAPELLIDSEQLSECDDERIFEFCGRWCGRAGVAYRAWEAVWFSYPSERDRITLGMQPRERAVLIHREFRSVNDELLLLQDVTKSPDAMLDYHRNLGWERSFRPHLGPSVPWELDDRLPEGAER